MGTAQEPSQGCACVPPSPICRERDPGSAPWMNQEDLQLHGTSPPKWGKEKTQQGQRHIPTAALHRPKSSVRAAKLTMSTSSNSLGLRDASCRLCTLVIRKDKAFRTHTAVPYLHLLPFCHGFGHSSKGPCCLTHPAKLQARFAPLLRHSHLSQQPA